MKCLLPALMLIAAALPASAVPAHVIEVVAAENFYGGVAAQIGGDNVHVTSILSNPNQDPHEFETDAATTKAVADADVVIYSGIGYDDWMTRLLGTAGKPKRIVIRVADLIGAKDGDNPHIWYDPRTMPALADRISEALFDAWGPLGGYLPFRANAKNFKTSMQPIADRIAALKAKYAGTTVTATEPVFGYMASALGFKMLNYDFQVAIMNDTEPSAAQTAAFEQSLTTKSAKVLFYNQQVTDPTTERLKKLAIASDIPVVGVCEMQPADAKNYVDWMNHTLDAVEKALDSR
jgi:zinc/manganese transport system substrate-binding protein